MSEHLYTFIPVDPMGAPRQTQSDRWRKRPVIVRYHEYRDEIRQIAIGYDACENFALKFFIAMPASWSKKKRNEMHGKPHTQKPDIDNLIKGVLDSILPNDQQVHTIAARKLWSVQGGIEVLGRL